MIIDPFDCPVDDSGREQVIHGSADFPIACYFNDLVQIPVLLHWHEELEAAIEDLEDEFADPDEDGMDVDDDLVDNDLEEADARMLEGLGIDLSQFAEDKSDENQEIEASEGGTAEDEAAQDAAEAESDNSAAKTAESDGNAGSKQPAASEE